MNPRWVNVLKDLRKKYLMPKIVKETDHFLEENICINKQFEFVEQTTSVTDISVNAV